MSRRSISPFERYGKSRPVEDAALLTHIFTATDTLSAIAEKFYDDWRLWRIIAERNNLTDVREIETGTVLIIPRRPLEKGRFESL